MSDDNEKFRHDEVDFNEHMQRHSAGLLNDLNKPMKNASKIDSEINDNYSRPSYVPVKVEKRRRIVTEFNLLNEDDCDRVRVLEEWKSKGTSFIATFRQGIDLMCALERKDTEYFKCNFPSLAAEFALAERVNVQAQIDRLEKRIAVLTQIVLEQNKTIEDQKLVIETAMSAKAGRNVTVTDTARVLRSQKAGRERIVKGAE